MVRLGARLKHWTSVALGETAPRGWRWLFAIWVLLLASPAFSEVTSAEVMHRSKIQLVAHALGAVDGVTYTNSIEAFETNYAAGARWFEVDLSLTADGDIVCFHRDHEKNIGLEIPLQQVKTENFLTRRYEGRFHLMTFSDLLARAARLGNVRLIMDTKEWNGRILEAFARLLASAPNQQRRIVVPQIYHPSDLPALRALEMRFGRFSALVFTLYLTAFSSVEVPVLREREHGAAIELSSEENVATFVKREHIPFVTIRIDRFGRVLAARLHAAGARVLVHPVNDPSEVARLVADGADGVYSYFLRPRLKVTHHQRQ